MKLIKLLTSGLLAVFLTIFARTAPSLVYGNTSVPEPVLQYDFENETDAKTVTDKKGENNAALVGRATVQHVPSKKSKALHLMGTNGYLEFPKGFFDGRDTMTISMDICSLMSNENFFTVAIGKDNTNYLFLRTRSGEFRYAITKGSWGTEDDVAASGEFKETWVNVALVLDGTAMRLYLNGECVDEQTNLRAKLSDFGNGVLGYLGKSFYDGDKYFKGYIDNVCVYDTALSATQIACLNGVEAAPFRDIHIAGEQTSLVTWSADKEEKVLTVYTSKSNGAATDNVELQFITQEYVTSEGNLPVPYGSEAEISFKINDGTTTKTESWTIRAVLCSNPVLGGQYADPDIDIFGDTYYLYTTTDGFSGWSGTKFHVFSSKNLVDWTDEGVILDVAKGGDVPWSVGNAWAPSIEEKNGKYYFYFCAKDPSGDSHIGVAVADSPTGPFVAEKAPLMTVAMCKSRGVSMGQAIDPSIFTEEDGTSYMLFGNGSPAIIKLNDDMISCDLSTLQNYQGANGFREAITVTKRNGIYHFTWSCDDTGSPNYHVNYGISDSIYGPIEYKYILLQKNADLDILGTGHHSILQIPGEDEYYIAYHRFFTPLGFFSDGTGHHRQTCIDKVTFDDNGLMNVVTPTLQGVEARVLSKAEEQTSDTPEDYVTASPITKSKNCFGYLVAGLIALITLLIAFIALHNKKKRSH